MRGVVASVFPFGAWPPWAPGNYRIQHVASEWVTLNSRTGTPVVDAQVEVAALPVGVVVDMVYRSLAVPSHLGQ